MLKCVLNNWKLQLLWPNLYTRIFRSRAQHVSSKVEKNIFFWGKNPINSDGSFIRQIEWEWGAVSGFNLITVETDESMPAGQGIPRWILVFPRRIFEINSDREPLVWLTRARCVSLHELHLVSRYARFLRLGICCFPRRGRFNRLSSLHLQDPFTSAAKA